MTPTRDSRREDARLRILRLLDADPYLTQRSLAQKVGLSVGAVHYALNALAEEGLIKMGNFTSTQDKRRYAYLLTPSGIGEKARLARRFLARKVAEAQMLEAEITSIYQELDLTSPDLATR